MSDDGHRSRRRFRFIGGYTLRAIAEAGHDALAIGRRESQVASGARSAVIADYCDGAPLETTLAGANAVIYLAGRAHRATATAEDITESRRANFEAPLICARAAARAGVRRFVFVSTIGVHGDATERDQALTADSPIAPVGPYAAAKHEAEIALRAEANSLGLAVIAVRPPLVYAHDAPGNFARLLRLTASGLPLPFGSIANRRSFIAAENLAALLVACATTDRTLPSAVVCADDDVISTADAVHAIARGIGKHARVWPLPPRLLGAIASLAGRAEDLQKLTGDLVVNNAQAKAATGWQPRIATADGMANAGKRFAAQRRK